MATPAPRVDHEPAADHTRSRHHHLMTHEIDFDAARSYAIPLVTRFRGITVREGMLIPGPAGWGEFCPFADYDDHESASWLATTIEQCTVG